MWTPVQTTSAYQTLSFTPMSPDSTTGGSGGVYLSDQGCPTARCKQAMCPSDNGLMYLMGGRAGSLPLKDIWRFDPQTSQWEELKSKGSLQPPSLQEHTMNYYKGKLYIFGGEVGFSSNEETPLWILDLSTMIWRKYSSSLKTLQPGATRASPSGRRGHSAVIFDGGLHIYGGYEDLKGSLSELWVFDLTKEQWHLVAGNGRASSAPSGRYSHTSVIDESSMYVFGGMSSLEEKNDLWEWNFVSKKWRKVKTNGKGPGPVHNHSAVTFRRSMFTFGGERKGQLLCELWRFIFSTNTWTRIVTEGILPEPRSKHSAVNVSFYQVKTFDDSNGNSLHLTSVSPSDDLKHEEPPQVPQVTSTRMLTKSNCDQVEGVVNSSSLYARPSFLRGSAKNNRSRRNGRKTYSLVIQDPITSILEDKLSDDSRNMTHKEEMELPEMSPANLNRFKRHTVHESMSYYSLCFPSPQLPGTGINGVSRRRKKTNDLSTGEGDSSSPDTLSPSSPIRQLSRNNKEGNSTDASGDGCKREDNRKNRSTENRKSCPVVASTTCFSPTTPSTTSEKDKPFDFSLFEFEEEDVLSFRRRSVNFRLKSQDPHPEVSEDDLTTPESSPTKLVVLPSSVKVPPVPPPRRSKVIDFDHHLDDETEDDASPINFSSSGVVVVSEVPGLMAASGSPLNGINGSSMASASGDKNNRPAHPTNSDYSLSNSIFTPSSTSESKSLLPHSKSSQYSSGYQSFTDDTIYDAGTMSKDQSCTSFRSNPFSTFGKTQQLPATTSLSLTSSSTTGNSNTFIDGRHPHPHPVVVLRRDANNESRQRQSKNILLSETSSSTSRSLSFVNRLIRRPILEYKSWAPSQINSIQEVVIPRSPAIRRSWSSYSPAKSKSNHHQHQLSHSFSTHERMEGTDGRTGNDQSEGHQDEDDDNNWHLVMYIFGGREEGSSFAHKQPIQVWKLYV